MTQTRLSGFFPFCIMSSVFMSAYYWCASYKVFKNKS